MSQKFEDALYTSILRSLSIDDRKQEKAKARFMKKLAIRDQEYREQVKKHYGITETIAGHVNRRPRKARVEKDRKEVNAISGASDSGSVSHDD